MTALAEAPRADARPDDESALAALIEEAAAARSPVELVAGGSRLGLGRPVQAERTIALGGLSGIDLYEPDALTLVAKAGTPLSALDAALAAEGQRLAFEPMDHRPLLGANGGEPTIGGVVACGVSGPRRIQAGGCRDSLLGVRFVNGRGRAISSGGRVMKNVTGYDLVKLLAGSFGTLGALTQVSFKVLPRPEHAATVALLGLDDQDGVAALSAGLGAPYDVTGAAHLPAEQTLDGDVSATLLRVEGFADSVRYRAGRLRELLAARFGRQARGVEVIDDAARSDSAWAFVRDVGPFHGAPGAVWRVSVKPSDGPGVVAAVAAARAEHGGARAFYDWGGGLVWLLTPESGDAGAAEIRGAAARSGGAATLVRASSALRAAIDVFPPQAPAVAALSRGLKAAFDPAGILNPGRMGL